MKEELPEFLQKIIKRYPEVWKNYESLGRVLSEQRGIDKRTQQLVKLGIAIASGSEGAVHSHVRRAKAEGISDEEVYHAALLSVTVIGWPKAVAALSWIDDVLKGIKS